MGGNVALKNQKIETKVAQKNKTGNNLRYLKHSVETI